MNYLARLLQFMGFGGGKKQDADPVVADAFSYAPNVSAGRSSVDENQWREGHHSEITTEFVESALPLLKKLSINQQDFGKALDNVLNLGNTRQEIYFDDKVSEALARKMRAYLAAQEPNWYVNSSPTAFVNSLLMQLAVLGALSAEAVPNRDLTGVERLVTVDVEQIKFFQEGGRAMPYQRLNITPAGLKLARAPYVRLNPAQYSYVPLVKSFSTPYGIPPFYAAIKSAGVQDEMGEGFKSIVRRIGSFGFLQLLLDAPARKKNHNNESTETDEEYRQRVEVYIKRNAEKLQDGLNKGIVAGIKGKHDFNLVSSSAAGNAAEMYAMIDTLVATGLKQDPSLLGRNRTVTETFGRVILQILNAQVETMQQIVADFLSKARLLALQLAGFNVREVITVFAPPMRGDEIKQEQAMALKIANAKELYNQGIITQQQMAEMLGYDRPALDAPRDANAPAQKVPIPPDGRTAPTVESKSRCACKRKSAGREWDSLEASYLVACRKAAQAIGCAYMQYAHEDTSTMAIKILEAFDNALSEHFALKTQATRYLYAKQLATSHGLSAWKDRALIAQLQAYQEASMLAALHREGVVKSLTAGADGRFTGKNMALARYINGIESLLIGEIIHVHEAFADARDVGRAYCKLTALRRLGEESSTAGEIGEGLCETCQEQASRTIHIEAELASLEELMASMGKKVGAQVF